MGEADVSEPRYRNEEWLREQYWEKGKTQPEISDACGVSSTTIGEWMDKHEIKTRQQTVYGEEKYHDKEWLREQYCKKNKSQAEIADGCGVSRAAIGKWVGRFDIHRREQDPNQTYSCEHCDEVFETGGALNVHETKIHERPPTIEKETLEELYVEEGLTDKEIGERLGFVSAVVTNWRDRHGIEARALWAGTNPIPLDQAGEEHKYRDGDLLRKLYHDKEMSLKEIAEHTDSTTSNVWYWFDRHGIETRERGAVIDDHPAWASGSDSPQWKGGTAPYGEGWNESKRQDVRETAGHMCEGCGMSQKAHRDQYGRRLHVHHITPARQFDNAERRNAADNLAVLCFDCHATAEQMAPLYPFAD